MTNIKKPRISRITGTQLTMKQKKFVEYYLQSFNATQSAIAAGYKEHSARMIASENLSKPYIREIIDKCVNSTKESDIIGFWINVVESKKAQNKDKLRASELLAKARGMFDDSEGNTTNNIAIFTDVESSILEKVRKRKDPTPVDV